MNFRWNNLNILRRGRNMRCTRCEGLLVMEWLYDPYAEMQYVQAQRCVNCGHVHEPMMETNRRKVSHDHSV